MVCLGLRSPSARAREHNEINGLGRYVFLVHVKACTRANDVISERSGWGGGGASEGDVERAVAIFLSGACRLR